MKTFWIRTASAAVYAILFLGSIYSGRLFNNTVGTIILTAFALFVAIGCAFEYYRIAAMKGAKPQKWLGYFFTAVMVTGLGLFSLGSTGSVFGDPGYKILNTCVAILFLATPISLMVQLWRNSEHPFDDVLHTLLPVVYCGLPLGLMPFIHHSANILVMCIIMVWVNDSFAYMGGSLVGKHKMWPKHSPGKTWEGTAIGVIACILTGVFAGPLFDTNFAWYHWIVLGFVCSIIGTLGDLVESMLKRSVGLKDSGKIMPGHGGFLDRFDSLLMILPFAAIMTLLFS